MTASIAGFKACYENDESRALSAYNVACGYSLQGDATAAVEWLERALDAGFSSVEHLETDTDLVTLRSDRRFQKLRDEQRKIRKERRERGDTSARDLYGDALDA